MRHVLVMGICGTGKSSVAGLLAERSTFRLVEADEYHSAEAIERMARGEPLTDADRWGWLDRVADAALATGGSTVIACSALKQAYRDRLESRLGTLDIIYLHGARDLVARRMADRPGHYMPASLIDSQIADLEPPEGRDVIPLDIAESLETSVEAAHQFATRARTGT